MISVMLVDDDALVLNSLKTLLSADAELTIAGEGHSGEEALALYPALMPDVVLMDIRMKGITGLEAGRRILDIHTEARILYLTTFADDAYIIEALSMGAKGYLLKQHYEGIAPAIKAVCLGQRVYGDAIADKLPKLQQQKNNPSCGDFGLNEKEFSIMQHVANGLSNKEIGETIYLSEGTVRNYISGIFLKLDLRDRTQLAIFYYRNFAGD